MTSRNFKINPFCVIGLMGKYVSNGSNSYNLHFKFIVVDWLNRVTDSMEHVFTNVPLTPIECCFQRFRSTDVLQKDFSLKPNEDEPIDAEDLLRVVSPKVVTSELFALKQDDVKL